MSPLAKLKVELKDTLEIKDSLPKAEKFDKAKFIEMAKELQKSLKTEDIVLNDFSKIPQSC